MGGLDERAQQNWIERFNQIVVPPHLDAAHGAAALVQGGDQDHWRATGAGLALMCFSAKANDSVRHVFSSRRGGVVLFTVEAEVTGDSGLRERVLTEIVGIDLTERQNEPKLDRSKRNLFHLMKLAEQSSLVQLRLFRLFARGLQRLQILESVAIVPLKPRGIT